MPFIERNRAEDYTTHKILTEATCGDYEQSVNMFIFDFYLNPDCI
jgi:hypothetical protein